MKKYFVIFITILVSTLFIQNPVQSAELKRHNILLVIDSSGAMNQSFGETKKIDVVRDSLKSVFKSLNENPEWGLNMGLRIFGNAVTHQTIATADTWNLVPIEWFDPTTLSNALDGIKPKGKAPLADAITKAGKDFPHVTKPPWPRNVIVIITAANDDFDKNIMQSAKEIEKSYDVLHVISIKMPSEDAAVFENLTKETNGQFINIQSSDELNETLLNMLTANVTPKPNVSPKPNVTPKSNVTPKPNVTPKTTE